MTKRIETAKHHYVPQFLLRNFAVEKRDQIHAFDKSNNKQFPIGIPDAAAERGYYTYEAGGVTKCLEDFFTQVENEASPLVQQIVRNRELPNLDQLQRRRLARFVAAQAVRSKNTRVVNQQIGDMLRELVARDGTPELKAWVPPYDPKEEKGTMLAHAAEQIASFVPHLLCKDILLFIAPGPAPLLIGDSPVTRTNTFNVSDYRGTTGFASPGVEIYLPLSPDVALAFMCTSIGETMRKLVLFMGHKANPLAFNYLFGLESRRTLALAPDNVLHINSLQVRGAERFIYSGTDDFSLAREMVDSDPDLRHGPRLTSNQGV